MQLDTEPRGLKGEFPIVEKTQSHQLENINTQDNTLRCGESKNIKLQLDLVADTTGAIHSGNLMNSPPRNPRKKHCNFRTGKHKRIIKTLQFLYRN